MQAKCALVILLPAVVNNYGMQYKILPFVSAIVCVVCFFSTHFVFSLVNFNNHYLLKAH